MDFNHPIGELWHGFVNPHYKKCPTCDGAGTTTAMQRLEDLVSLLMLSGDDAQLGKCHPYFCEAPLHRTARVVPSADMMALTGGLAGRGPTQPVGHDAIDRWSATRKIITAAGVPEKWGTCPDCDGDGIAADTRQQYEAWTSYEPPTGDGWQLWSTTTEGHPMSPVCATPEALAKWLADTGASSFGSSTATYDQWLAMITAGWAPSMVASAATGAVSGVEAVSALTAREK
jgi:hypothetical protein